MSKRNVITIFFCLVVLVLAIEVKRANHALLDEQSLLVLGQAVPLGWALGGLLGLGLLLVLATMAINSAGNYLSHLGAGHEHRFREGLEAKYLRGLEAHLGGRHADALRVFGEVLDLEPHHPGALLRAGEACQKMGRGDEAIAHHRRLVEQAPADGTAVLALTQDYLGAGRRSDARLALAAYLQNHGSDPAALRKLRAIYLEEENWSAAQEVQQRLAGLKIPFSEGEAQLALIIPYEIARAALKAGRHKEAAAKLEKLAKEHPDFVPGQVLRGDIAAKQDTDFESAIDIWHAGFAATRQPVFLQKIEDLLIVGGDPEMALSVFRAAAAEFPDHLLVRFFLAKLLFRLELRQEAEKEFKRLAGLHQDSPTLNYYLGRLAERRGDLKGAAEAFRAVIRGARVLDIHYRCDQCREKQDDWADRCTACKRWNSLAVEWRDPVAHETLGGEANLYTASGATGR